MSSNSTRSIFCCTHHVGSCDWSDVFAVELVGLEDGLLVPVGPVDPVLEGGHRERVLQHVGRVQNDSSVLSVVVARRDSVEFGVDPVNLSLDQVQGQTVGPLDLVVDDGLAVGAVHAGALDLGLGAPVRPVHPAVDGVEGDGARLLQVVLDQRFAHAAVKVGQFNGVLAGVGPVDVVVHPVHGQTVRGRHVVFDHHHFVLALVNRRPERKQGKYLVRESSYWGRFLH